MTEVIKTKEDQNKTGIEEAAKTIKNKGLVIYPTETCYGLGADATEPAAIRKVYEVKKRKQGKPISVAVSGVDQLRKFGKLDERALKLIEEFLPGPLTIIVMKKRGVPNVLSKRGIGFRIPAHPVALSLPRRADTPVTATSANISGNPPIYSSEKVKEIFRGKVDLILDAGKISEKEPSTIISLLNKPKVLREGPITAKEIFEVID